MKQVKHFLPTIAAILCSITSNAHEFAVDGIYYNVTSEAGKAVEVTFEGASYDSNHNVQLQFLRLRPIMIQPAALR